MKEIIRFIKTTLLGGLLLVVPLVLVIIILAKVLSVVQRTFRPLTKVFEGREVGGIPVQQVMAALVIILVCFIAGLMAKTKLAKRFLKWMEDTVLQYLPGYRFLKSISRTSIGLEAEEMKIVLVRVDDGWQISFLIEQINDNLYTVFVPNAPSPLSGCLYHVEKDRIIWTDMTRKQAMDCIRQLGFGSADLLKKNWDSSGKLKQG